MLQQVVVETQAVRARDCHARKRKAPPLGGAGQGRAKGEMVSAQVDGQWLRPVVASPDLDAVNLGLSHQGSNIPRQIALVPFFHVTHRKVRDDKVAQVGFRHRGAVGAALDQCNSPIRGGRGNVPCLDQHCRIRKVVNQICSSLADDEPCMR